MSDRPDLVKQLRFLAQVHADADPPRPAMAWLCNEAADTIAALVDAVEPLVKKAAEQERDHTSGHDCYVQIGAVFFEDVEAKLNAALSILDGRSLGLTAAERTRMRQQIGDLKAG